MPTPAYRFANVEVRPATRQLMVDGAEAAIGARAFDLLVTLVEHRDRLLSKDELLDRVWPGLVVEENNLQVQVSSLRKLIGPKAIATVPARGYRFVATLAEGAAPAAPVPAAPVPEPVAFGGLLPPPVAVIGRAAEREALAQRVTDQRLVTVVGAGGIGKTCLARAVAHDLAGAFRDRAVFVELDAVAAGADVTGAVARALRIQLPATGGAAELAERLGDEQLLLVLDNCEHLGAAVALLVQALLDALPGLHVLATSQEPLHLAREQVLRLAPLVVPAPGALGDPASHGAVALFVARVQAQHGAFRLDAANADDVAEVVRQLDGLPLAIELAAARVPLLGVSGVRRNLGERLRLLTGGARDLPSRHRTLRSTYDWSHALLSDDERTVFRRLGIFVGGFGLDLAQQVVADEQVDPWAVLDHLGTLIDKSLVVAETGTVPRYRLLESARAYALEQLQAAGELTVLRRRLAERLRNALVGGARAAIQGQGTLDDWALAGGAEVDNLRAAIDWAAGEGADAALALSLVNIAAVLMYQIGRYPECVRWMRAVEPLIDAHTPPGVLALFHQGLALVGLHGGLSAAQRREHLQQALAIFRRDGPPGSLAITLTLMSYVAAVSGDFATANDCLTECEQCLGSAMPRSLRCIWLYNLGMLRRYEGRHAEALAAFEAALPLAREVGNARQLFYVLNNLAAACRELGRLEQALAGFDATLEHLRRSPLTDAQMMAFALMWSAQALVDAGRLAEAQQRVIEAVPLARRSTGLRHFAGFLAHLAARQGRAGAAARLLGCDDAARERRGEPRIPSDERELQATLALLAPLASAAQLQAWRRTGRELDEDSVQALALALAGAG